MLQKQLPAIPIIAAVKDLGFGLPCGFDVPYIYRNGGIISSQTGRFLWGDPGLPQIVAVLDLRPPHHVVHGREQGPLPPAVVAQVEHVGPGAVGSGNCLSPSGAVTG